MIKLLYFARLREELGTDAEQLSLPPEVKSVADLRAHLRDRGEPWSIALAEEATIMAAVNQEIARLDTAIGPGDEVAFFPPVTGG